MRCKQCQILKNKDCNVVIPKEMETKGYSAFAEALGTSPAKDCGF